MRASGRDSSSHWYLPQPLRRDVDQRNRADEYEPSWRRPTHDDRFVDKRRDFDIRLAPVRVAALRGDAATARGLFPSAHEPTARSWPHHSSSTDTSPTFEHGLRVHPTDFDVALRRHEANAGLPRPHRLTPPYPRGVEPQRLSERTPVQRGGGVLNNRLFDYERDRYQHDGPWRSPRSSHHDSRHEETFSTPFGHLDDWNRLRIESQSDMSVGSNSPAQSQRSQASQSNSPVPESSAPRPTVKQSRYLREMDRRIILSRLAKGEKQAALAKEYGVSRSTICNLLKQRDIVLARKDENPLSRHPKKTRLSRAKANMAVAAVTPPEATTSPTNQVHPRDDTVCSSSRTPPPDDQEEKSAETAPTPDFLSFDDDRVIEVQSRPISLLKTKLHDRDTSDDDFRGSSSRLMRLLLEEAIGIVAARPRDSNEQIPAFVDSVFTIAMSEHGTSLLDVFRTLEPEVPTGLIGSSLSEPSQLELHIISHPSDLKKRAVLLLDVVLASGDAACSAIDLLQSRGVSADRITLVALFVAAEVVALVQYVHPRVRILTTGVDVQLHHRIGSTSASNSSSSSSRAFFQRFLRTPR